MNLVIHDLSPDDWKKVRQPYAGWAVVSEKKPIHPCVGCFGCWKKTPGQCVMKDGYEKMGALIHHSDEVVVISRYTYGGFSGFVKNVFDRSLGYVLPHFEIVEGESHHRKRYEEDKPFTFIFYGNDLTEEEKDSARQYVRAVCTNIRGHVKEVIFRETDRKEADACREEAGTFREEAPTVREEAQTGAERTAGSAKGKIVLLNGSMRTEKGNSGKFALQLKKYLNRDAEIVELKRYLQDPESLVRALEDADTIVLCTPLYVDGLPSQVIRLLETFERTCTGGPKKIYLLANMGLYESRQLRNLFGAVSQWCGRMNYDYCGGLGISAGELIGALIGTVPFGMGPLKQTAEGIQKLAEAVSAGDRKEDLYAEPTHFPRFLYISIANHGWNRGARENGIRPSDLYRRL